MKANQELQVVMCDELSYLVNECGYSESEAAEMLRDENDYASALYVAI